MFDINTLNSDMQLAYNELTMPVDTNIKLDSVILSNENQDKIKEFLVEYNQRDKLLEYGLVPMSRLLFYGDSGTGKTYLSKALTNFLGYTMLYVDIANALSEGRVAVSISNIFRLARAIKQCIIFFDEVDSIAWSRDSSNAESGDIRRATNSIFQNIDQMDKSCIFIAATNMLHRLDPAFQRRFDMILEFKIENVNVMSTVRKFTLPQFKILNDVDANGTIVVERCINNTRFSYASVGEIVQRNEKRAILRGKNVIKLSDVYKDIGIRMGTPLNFLIINDATELLEPLS
jgi:SpoVK/Ycf46/Vps4 family AAA+-type ATPase